MANKTIGKAFNNANESVLLLKGRILKLLDEKGALPRKEIVKALNTPRSTVYDNLLQLQKRKIVEKFSRSNGKRGRSVVYWKLSEEELTE